MKYYVVSDVHGFYTPMQNALQAAGFFSDTAPHKLILCGDMMDRGSEAVEMQNFMLDLLHKDELIFVRGNHEDLMLDMLGKYDDYLWDIVSRCSHHYQNGTFGTAWLLSGMKYGDALSHQAEFCSRVRESPFVKELIPASIDYFETKNYVFVHGWIPTTPNDRFDAAWRTASPQQWDRARWQNGMEMAEERHLAIRGKTVVCGHWHASFGNSRYLCRGTEFGSDAVHTPYYGNRVIAIDGCTALSHRVNCIVIEDEEIKNDGKNKSG